MQLLPLVDPASRSTALLPVSDASAILLARTLLESESGNPCDGPLLKHLKNQLSDDPPMAIWVVWHAQGLGDVPPNRIAAAAEWLLHNPCRLLAPLSGVKTAGTANPVSEPVCLDEHQCTQEGGYPGDTAFYPRRVSLSAAQIQRLADQVAHRVVLAELAARLAAQKHPCEPEKAELARLAGLTFAADDWNLGAKPAGGLGLRVPDAAQPLIAEALGLLGSQTVSAGPLPDAQASCSRAVEAKSRWLLAIPGAESLLPALAERLTSLKKLQELQRDFSARLESEKLAALAEFAAGAGHEINNPLANISGRAQLLLRSEADPERRRELAMIVAQAQRAHQMIADLWLFARPPEPQFRRIDLIKVAEQTVAELGPWAAEHSIELLRTGPSDPIWTHADPVQLHVALGALVTNAIEAIGTEGRVEVSVECSAQSGGQEVRIRVTDTGPGIAPEHRRHLFDPFYSGRQAGRGLGLGLSKAWRIVRNHGGRIEVADVARGASLVIVLPLVASASQEDSPG